MVGILGLNYTDVIALVIVPAITAVIAFFKWLQVDKEKFNEKLRHDLEVAEKKLNAEVEKERIQSDLQKVIAKEQSLGGLAVAKMWEEITKTKDLIERIQSLQQEEKADQGLIKEVLKMLQQEVSNMQKVFFEMLKK